jgi:dolichol-phosphate mannosyltransferase
LRNVIPHPALASAPPDPAPSGEAAERVAVVVPCYRVSRQILGVLQGIGGEIRDIYVVDDCCPEDSGRLVERKIDDPRVHVIFHGANQGVGGATMTGMRAAIADGADIIIKIDGDGQMDTELLPVFIELIRSGEADYAKGNRFYEADGVTAMPWIRLLGNAILSFFAKLSTGYWHSFDPNDGYIAIHAEIARRLPFEKIHRRYFFETDLLFRLRLLQARVVDVPMSAVYGDETSNLHVGRELLPFVAGHLRNLMKRILYMYFLRDFSIASLELLIGFSLLIFGVAFGLANWNITATGAPAGTVMLAALPVILGVQLLLAFLAYDIQSVPTTALHLRLRRPSRRFRAPARAVATP